MCVLFKINILFRWQKYKYLAALNVYYVLRLSIDYTFLSNIWIVLKSKPTIIYF